MGDDDEEEEGEEGEEKMPSCGDDPRGPYFFVPVGSLGFSVTVFCIEAGLAIAILFARRSAAVGGELGGPKLFKTISSSLFVFFWVFYVAISAMEAYGVINPGF